MTKPTPFGPTGQLVYERTYSRTQPDGTKEQWPDTVRRVARGNLALVYGDEDRWSDEVREEFADLVSYMEDFRIIPAGRHLWATGVPGRQYLFNCHVAPWGEKLSRHFEFTFLRLMEGGGVGANYSSRHLAPYGAPRRELDVHIVCDPAHQDYAEMEAAGLISDEYDSDWAGAWEVEDSREGWAAALVDLIDTFMADSEVKHRARVYDVSRVRPKGARLKTFGGTASGPQPFARMMGEVAATLSLAAVGARLSSGLPQLTPLEAMRIDHAIAECVVSGGVRRSARMSIVHWADPWIEEFIACKQDGGAHWTTNISVEVDDDFFAALESRDDMHSEVGANAVLRLIARGMLANGEPGVWNSSLSSVGEVGTVIATNPCGEIALEPAENCNLGHVNLDAAVDMASGGVDLQGLRRAHRLMTRFLVRATFGDVNDEQQAAMLARNRRIGVGHLGVQGFLAKQGVRYSDAARHEGFRGLLEELRDEVRTEARRYACKLRIPEPVKVTAIAPTGSIAKLPGVTEGIHPIYARHFLRRVRFNVSDPEQAATVDQAERDGLPVERDIYDQSGNTWVVAYPTRERLVAEVAAMGIDPLVVESADELTLGELLEFQAMYQQHYADNAVSFTANVNPDEYTEDRILALMRQWLPGLKGTTVMPDGSRPQAPYERITAEQYAEYAEHLAQVADSVDEECASGACPIR